jgi:putative addiction module antidote
MKRKICVIGNSRGVSIPKDILNELDLSAGSEVNISADAEHSRIIIEPVHEKELYQKGVDKNFVSQVNDFIEKYGPALKELAKK